MHVVGSCTVHKEESHYHLKVKTHIPNPRANKPPNNRVIASKPTRTH